ncbi:MAG: BtrH N-terminal domain-containing protein [Candidatus Thorarchaeota archaeon]
MNSSHTIETFLHNKGSHCESTTLRNLITHEGIKITEPMVFGLDCTFGFTFFNNSQGEPIEDLFGREFPIFIGGKQGSIVKDSMVCRVLGLNIGIETFNSSVVAWDTSKRWIMQNIPLGIQVDMGFLSYFDWPEEMHFGGHYITLTGFDEVKGVAFIYDTEFDDVQEVSIEELKKARRSKFGERFLHPHNKQVHILTRPDGKKSPFARAVKLALRQVAQQVVAPSTNYHGIPALRLFMESIPSWPNILKGTLKIPYSNKIVSKSAFTLEMVYRLIEEMGTGGAIFRNLYSNYLKELVDHPEIKEGINAWKEEELFYLEDAMEQITKSAVLWTEFSSNIEKALNQNEADCLQLLDLIELTNLIEEIINLEEWGFRSLLQIKL